MFDSFSTAYKQFAMLIRSENIISLQEYAGEIIII